MRNLTFRLSLVLIFAIPWENVVLIEGLGTISKGLGILVAVCWAGTLAVTGEVRRLRLFHVLVCLFVIWNALSIAWTIDVEATIFRMMTYVQVLVLILILWDLYRTPEALTAGLQAYVLGCYVSIISLINNYHAAVEYSFQRYAATNFNENDIGLILVLGMPVAWYLAVFGYRRKRLLLLRLVNYGYLPAALVAILLTGSRGSLLVTSPVLLFVLLTLSRLRLLSRVVVITSIACGAFLLPLFVPQASFQRLATIGSSIAEGDLGGRVEAWREALVIHDSHPLLGVGSGAFRTAAVRSKTVAHNVYLSVLAELGLVGLLLFSIIVAVCFGQTLRMPRVASMLWVTVLLIWSAGAFVSPWEQRKQTWLFLSLAVASGELFVRTDRSGSPASAARIR